MHEHGWVGADERERLDQIDRSQAACSAVLADLPGSVELSIRFNKVCSTILCLYYVYYLNWHRRARRSQPGVDGGVNGRSLTGEGSGDNRWKHWYRQGYR
jgi:hypothetical protein